MTWNLTPFGPADFPEPCALIKLPWPKGKNYTKLVLPNCPRSDANYLVSLLLHDFAEHIIIEEICSAPPSYSIRFVLGCNPETAESLLSIRQLMAITHTFNSADPLDFFQSAKYATLQANLESQRKNDERILIVHHSIITTEEFPLDSGRLTDLWQNKLLPEIGHIFSQATGRYHLVVFVDGSRDPNTWESSHMSKILHLNWQLTSLAMQTIPLKICQPSGFQTFQIVFMPNKSFCDSVLYLRNKVNAMKTSPLDRLPNWLRCKYGAPESVVNDSVEATSLVSTESAARIPPSLSQSRQMPELFSNGAFPGLADVRTKIVYAESNLANSKTNSYRYDPEIHACNAPPIVQQLARQRYATKFGEQP